MPSRMSLSVNLSRTHRPSVRGRVVKVFREEPLESEKSRTKSTLLISAKSIRMTLPDGFNSSSLPSTRKLAGATYPLSESRPIFLTMTFLWVEGMIQMILARFDRVSRDTSGLLPVGVAKRLTFMILFQVYHCPASVV